MQEQNRIVDAPVLSVTAYRLIAESQTVTAGARRWFVMSVFALFTVLCVALAITSSDFEFWLMALGCAAAVVGGYYMTRLRRRTFRMNGLYALGHSLVQLGMLRDTSEARQFARNGEVLSAPGEERLRMRGVITRGGAPGWLDASCTPPLPVTDQGYRPEVQPDGSTVMVPVGVGQPDGRYLSHVDAELAPRQG